MDTSAKTESITDVVKGLENRNIVLPEFQRGFVWEIGKTFDLFDSLIKDIFIGSIIYGVPSFEITTREIDIRSRTGQSRKEKPKIISYKKEEINKKVKTEGFRLLLDGQQRFTSIYRALKGVDAVWFIAKHPHEIGNDGNFNTSSLDQILLDFSGQESPDHLSVKLSDAFEVMQNSYRESIISENFFEKLEYPKLYEKNERNAIFNDYLTILSKLRDLFKSEKLLSYYLLDTTIEKFILFFERSNSKGIQLSFIDILAAKLYTGFNLKEKITEFYENYHYSLNEEIIVRTISFIVSGGKNVERSYILGKLTPEHFSEYWEPVCDWYRKTIEFLYKNHMILAQSWMPHENMLIPMIMFLRELQGNFSQMTEKQIKFIRFWYWSSIFAQRYTGSSNEIIIQDALILCRIAQEKKITDRNYLSKLRSQVISSTELHSFTKKGSAIYRGILNLINYHAKGLMDWKSTSPLSFNHSKLEDHHIFPQKYLKTEYSKKNDEDILSLMDSVVNKTLIPKLTNIKIGQKSPSIYLTELQKYNSQLKKSLENHVIPIGLIEGKYDGDYILFINERAEAIFKIIQDNINNIVDEIRSEFFGSS